MRKNIFLLFCICFFYNAASYAQLSSSFRFGRISVDKGLSQSTVYCSYQDSQGFLWFGTEDGLNKYDGYSFEVYKFDPADNKTLSNNIVRCIFEDNHLNLWIGTDNGLNIYNRSNGSFRRLQNIPNDPSSLSSNIISSVVQDSTGTVWVGTANGLNSYNESTGKFTSYKNNPADQMSISSNVISCLLSDNHGNIWVGTNSNGINLLDPVSKRAKRYLHNNSNPASLSEDEITSFALDVHGYLWVGTVNGGLNRMNIENETFTHFTVDNGLSSNSIFSIHQDANGILWIGSLGGGLNAYNSQTNQFSVYKNDPQNNESVSSNKIWSVFHDNSGTMWLGTANGISYYNRTIAKFVTYRIDNGSDAGNNNSVFAVCEDHAGNVWTGVVGGGLNVFSRAEGRFVSERFPSLNNPLLRYTSVFCIYEDRNNLLWLGTTDGLLTYKPSTGEVKQFRNNKDDASSLSNNYIRCISEDKSGTIWIGTHGGGLNALDPVSGKFRSWKNISGDNSSLSSDVVMNILEDTQGQMWIATYGGGLDKMDVASGKFTSYKNDINNQNSLSSNFIHCLFENKDGKLWIGTYGGGLNVLDVRTGNFKHYTERDGLPNNIINGIVSDKHGNIWLSTNNGMCKLRYQTDGSLLTMNNRTYTVQDGLQNKFNENAFDRGIGGWLYAGGSNGLNAFHPDSINDNTVIPPVVITRFYLFEKPTRMDTLISTKRTLDLNYRQNFFSFEFAALNYLFPEKNRYAYMMEGLNDEWIYSGTRRYATYTNLDPGNYVFRVKACNNDGVWNESGISIYITITPPLWKKLWFQILVALFVTLLVFFYIRLRTNSLIRQNLVLEDKISTRTFQLQEKNVELTKTMENLRATQNQLIQSEKMASLGQLTAGIAHEIQNPLNFVNNFSELSVELLDELNEEPPADEQKTLVTDLKQNLQKIVFHGKRADTIVKGMLQHSRTSAAEKQQTDINKIVEEFFTLAYHGMRAKDPGFNCIMDKHLAPNLPSVRIIPQDVSRVILNIFNNAFYSVDERSKTEGKLYKPTVLIATKQSGGSIVITIRDNGKGIPQEIRDKIFNPFFTTKPTGQGTGLGLSISYDIIVKGHSGDLQVNSTPGEFTEFKITLPI